jgi:phosphoribosylglycinamide formyltransferase-1
MQRTCNLVVLLSGSGSNLQALIDDLAKGDHPGRLRAVISNRPDAFGLTRAEHAGIETRVLDHRDFSDRAAFDQALMEIVDDYQPDLVILAGFMRILSEAFVGHYHGRLFNIHPSLLPKYKGLHTHARALEAGDETHGCSVHFVTEQLDGGPLVAQARLAVRGDDTASQLARRVHGLEHILYPTAIRWFAEGRLLLKSEGAMLDGEILPATGKMISTTSGDD